MPKPYDREIDMEASRTLEHARREEQERIKKEHAIMDAPPPEGYFWINQTIGLVLCSLCGVVVYSAKDKAQDGVLTHDLFHIQLRQLYKAVMGQ